MFKINDWKAEKENLILRIAYDLLLLIITIFFPWWVSLSFALLSTIFYKNFFEVIFVGLWIDSMHTNGQFFKIGHFFLIFSTIAYILSEKIRRFVNLV